MNQHGDFTNNSLKSPHEDYKAKCEALLALDREVKQMLKELTDKIQALDELELQLNKGA